MSEAKNEVQPKANLERVVIRPLFGYYVMQPVGIGSYYKVWKHNPVLKLSEQEQREINEKNHDDFKLCEYVPPAVEITCV